MYVCGEKSVYRGWREEMRECTQAAADRDTEESVDLRVDGQRVNHKP